MIKTILLVDRDQLFIEQIRLKFLSAGYRVLCACTQAEAERILAASRPDVVVTEIMLERQDSGFCLAWQAKKLYPEVPVIIISSVTWHTGLYFSLSTPEDYAWIKADHFLDKPIRVEELEAIILMSLKSAKSA